MAITKLNSLAIPPDTVVESDISFPLDSASFTGDLTVDTDTLVVDSTNNRVGIGDTAPDVKLKIKGGAGTIEPQVTIESTAFNAGQGTALNFSRAGFDQPIQARISAVDNGAAGSNFIFSTKADGTAGALTERMRIDGTSGNVGIGGTPESRLDVRNSAVSGNAAVTVEGYGGITGSINSGAGTGGTFISTQDTATLGLSFGFHGARNTSGHFDNPVIKMVLDTDGNLLVGRTSTPAISNSFDMGFRKDLGTLFINCPSSTGPLMLNQTTGDNATRNQIRFHRNETEIGKITSNTVEVFYDTGSDQRLKENIVDAPAGNIDAIRVRSFDWKADGSHRTYGMVAQELINAAPQAVTQGETDEDMWGVDYSKLVPMMIKEIQDLRARVAQLEGAN